MKKMVNNLMIKYALIFIWSCISTYILSNNDNVLKVFSTIKNNSIHILVIFFVITMNVYTFFIKKKSKVKSLFSILGIFLYGIFFLRGTQTLNFELSYIVKFSIGILGFFISIGNFARSITKKRFSYRRTIVFFSSVIVVWRILCENIVFGNIVEKNIKLNIILLFNVSVFFILWLYSEKINLKKIKEFIRKNNRKNIVIYEVIVLTIPMYLFKNSWVKTQWLVAGIALYLFFRHNLKNISKIEAKIYLIVTSILIYLLINYMLNNENNLVSKYYKNILYAYFFLIVFMQLKVSKMLFEKIIMVGAMSSLIPVVSSFLIWVDKDFAFGRISADYPTNWGATSSLLLIFFCFFIIFKGRQELLMTALLLLLAMIFTGSRGPIFAGLTGIFLMLITNMIITKFSYKQSIINVGIVAVVVSVFIFGNKTTKERFLTVRTEASSISRIYLFEESIIQIKNKPIVGNGYSTFKNLIENPDGKIKNSKNNLEKYARSAAYQSSHSHNNILETLRSGGVIGLFLYLILHVYLFYIYVLYFFKTKETFFLLPIFSYIVLEIAGTVDITMIYTRYQMILYFMYGIIFEKIRKYQVRMK